MIRFLALATIGLGVLCAVHDSVSAARPRQYSRSRTVRSVALRYQFTPLASGSTSQNRLRTAPRPIQFQQPRWADPGAYRSNFPANYGPGTGKSGPQGQRLYIHRVPYQGSNGGYTPNVIRIRPVGPPANGGAPAPRTRFGYDDNRSKSLP